MSFKNHLADEYLITLFLSEKQYIQIAKQQIKYDANLLDKWVGSKNDVYQSVNSGFT